MISKATIIPSSLLAHGRLLVSSVFQGPDDVNGHGYTFVTSCTWQASVFWASTVGEHVLLKCVAAVLR